MTLPARLKRLLKSSPATSELADYLEGEGTTSVEDDTDNQGETTP